MPSIAINKSIFTPVGKGGDDTALPDNTFINISYNFMTPVDADNTAIFGSSIGMVILTMKRCPSKCSRRKRCVCRRP